MGRRVALLLLCITHCVLVWAPMGGHSPGQGMRPRPASSSALFSPSPVPLSPSYTGGQDQWHRLSSMHPKRHKLAARLPEYKPLIWRLLGPILHNQATSPCVLASCMTWLWRLCPGQTPPQKNYNLKYQLPLRAGSFGIQSTVLRRFLGKVDGLSRRLRPAGRLSRPLHCIGRGDATCFL